MKKILLLLLSVVSTKAATFVALDASRTAVGNAYALCSDGDILQIPASSGTIYHWTNVLTITKAISIIGAGTNGMATNNPSWTLIADDIPSSASGTSAALFNFTTVSNKLYRVSGIQFAQDTTRSANSFDGMIQFTGSSKGVRVDNCLVNNTQKRLRFIVPYGSVAGVADHNGFILISGSLPVPLTAFQNTWNDHGTWGDGSFEAPLNLGTTNTFMLEDCWGYAGFIKNITDAFAGARMAARNCIWTNMYFDSHGTESGGRYRGLRSFEIYNNQQYFTLSNGELFNIRSGTGVIFNNIISNATGGIVILVCGRQDQVYSPWGGASGTNVWDNNGSLVLTGVVTTATSGGSLILEDTTANFDLAQIKGLVFQNLASGKFATPVTNSSTSTRIDMKGSAHLAEKCYWTNGNPYRAYFLTAALDGPGMGQSDYIGGTSLAPTPVGWPNQQVEPIYAWNNTNNGALISQHFATVYFMRDGEHYTNGVVMPGYNQLIYPHPLVSGTPFNPPTITPLPDITIVQDTSTTNITFTIGDVETPAGSLTLSKGCNNTTLVPLANIVFGGSGASRTVQVTPTIGQTGAANITVTVTDGDGNTASAPFTLTVVASPGNIPPTISSILNQEIGTNANTGALAFTVSDTETPATNLVVTATSSNTNAIPFLTLGGTSTNRTITVGSTNIYSFSEITLSVSDGTTNATTSFIVNVPSPLPTTTVRATNLRVGTIRFGQ